MDVEAIVGLTAAVAALALVVPLLLVHAGHKQQLIEDAWRKLADRHGMQFQPGRKLQVSGVLGGRAFVMKSAGAGNNVSYNMEFALDGPLPSGLTMKSIGKRGAAVEKRAAPGMKVNERTGRIDINEAVRVGGQVPSELSEYLTVARTRAALRLIDVGGELDGHKLSVGITGHPDDLEDLDHAVGELLAIAPVLEQSRRPRVNPGAK